MLEICEIGEQGGLVVAYFTLVCLSLTSGGGERLER